MPKKRKKAAPEKVIYQIEVHDWDVSYFFSLNTVSLDFIDGAYWGSSQVILFGKLHSPEMKNAATVRVEISGDSKMDDYWKAKPTIKSAKAIGWMEIPRGDDTLIFHCSVPYQELLFITLAVNAGKIKFASIFGTKLKWRKGTVTSMTLAKEPEEE